MKKTIKNTINDPTKQLPEKAQVTISLIKDNPDASNHEIGKKLQRLGIYSHAVSIYDILKNPIVKAEVQKIRDLHEEAKLHNGLKAEVMKAKKLDHINQHVPVEKWGAEERNWVTAAGNSVPEIRFGGPVQLNYSQVVHQIFGKIDRKRKDIIDVNSNDSG
jgi:hypothetical protein